MAEAAVNGGSSTLLQDITAVATQVRIQAADLAKFPAAGTYRIVLSDGIHTEICTVTGGQGTGILTVTRASEPYGGVQTAWAFAAITPTTVEPVLTLAGLLAIIQQQAKDLPEGTAPANPSASTLRLWADALDQLHLLSGAGADATVIDTRHAAGGDLSGSFPSPIIIPDAITTAKILNGSVTGPKIAARTIDATKIALATITAAEIANNTIGNSQLVGGAAAANIGALGGVLSGTLPNPAFPAQNDIPGFRASTATTAAAGEGIEIPYTPGSGGSIQSYNRGTGAWRDLAINAHNISLGPQAGGSITLNGPITYPAGYTTKVLYDAANASDMWSNTALGAGNNGLPGYPANISVDANAMYLIVILQVAAMISPSPTYAWMGWDIATQNVLYQRGSRQRVNSGNTESVSYTGVFYIVPANSGGYQVGPWIYTDAAISGGMYLRCASYPATEFLRLTIIEVRA